MHYLNLVVQKKNGKTFDKAVDFAESVDELTADQFVKFSRIVYSDKPYYEKLIWLTRYMCMVDRVFSFLGKTELSWTFVARHIDGDEYYNKLIPFAEKLLEQLPLKMVKFVFNDFHKKMEGPGDMLYDLCWLQYTLIEERITGLGETPDEDELNETIACMFRQKGKHFVDSEFGAIKKKVEGWSMDVRMAIVLNYVAVRRCFVELYSKYVYVQVDDQDAGKNADVVEPPDFLMLSLTLAGGPFGNRDAVEREPARNVLKWLEMKGEEREKAEEEMKKK